MIMAYARWSFWIYVSCVAMVADVCVEKDECVGNFGWGKILQVGI